MISSQQIKKFWLLWDKLGVFVIFLFVVVLFGAIEPTALALDQFISVLTRSSWVAVAAAGMTFAICSGGFDLSVGSIMSLCGSVLARLITNNGFPTWAAILVTLGIAVCCGFINGILITKLKIQPFVATLATMLIFNSVTQVYTKNIGTRIPNELYDPLKWLGRDTVMGIPVKLIVLAVIFVLVILIYQTTKFGTKVRAIGSNEAAARTSGINADNVLITVYIITAVTAALGAVLYTATLQSASPNAGSGFELRAITAVILGGTALSGGKGNLIGSLVGAILVAFSDMCLTLLSAGEAWRVIVTGAILLFALSISGIKIITQREVS